MRIRNTLKYTLIALAMLGISGITSKVQADPTSISDLDQIEANGGNTLSPNGNAEEPYEWHRFLWIRTTGNASTLQVSFQVDRPLVQDNTKVLHNGDYLRIKIPACQQEGENPAWDYKLSATDVLMTLTPYAPAPLDCILGNEDFWHLIVGTAGAGWNLVGIENNSTQNGYINIVGDYSDMVLVNYDLITQIQLGQGDEERLSANGDLYVYFGSTPPTEPSNDDGDGPVIGPNDPFPGDDSITDPGDPGLGTDDGGLIPPSVDLPDDEDSDPVDPQVGEGTDPSFPDFDDKGITPDEPNGQAYMLTGGGCSLEAVPQSGSIFNLLILALFGMGGFLPRILKRK